MIPWVPDRTRGVGTLCPCCKVPGTPETVRHGILKTYRWSCGICGARGDATRSRTPARVMWHGIDMGKAPVQAPGIRGTVPVRELDAEIRRTRALVSRSRASAERKGTVATWTVVLGYVEHLEHLLKRKYAVSLDLLGTRK